MATQFACVVLLVQKHVVNVTSCVGPSMLPTFNLTGDVVSLSPLLPFS